LFFEEIPRALDPSRNKFIVANNDVVLCAPVSPPRRHTSVRMADDGMFP